MQHRVQAPPSRRTAVRLGVLAALVVAGTGTGCGLRLERGAPGLPLIPASTPHPAEGALRAELVTVGAALAVARAVAPPPGPTQTLVTALRVLHADQERVLQARLARLGAPAPEAAVTPGTPAAELPALLRAEGIGIGHQARAALGQVPPSDRALVAALLAQRAAAWLRMGAAGTTVGLRTAVAAVPGPDGRSLLPGPAWAPSAGLAVRLAPAASAARYGAEVIAARAVPAQVPAATTGLAALAGHAARLTEAAREAARPDEPELGYVLPFRVATAAEVARLARHVWTGWARAVAAALVPAGESRESGFTPPAPTPTQPISPSTPAGAADPTASRTAGTGLLTASRAGGREQTHAGHRDQDPAALVGWLLEAELMRQRWAAPAVPFPGLHWSR